MSVQKSQFQFFKQVKSFVEIPFIICDIINVKTIKNFIRKISVKFMFFSMFASNLVKQKWRACNAKNDSRKPVANNLGWSEKTLSNHKNLVMAKVLKWISIWKIKVVSCAPLHKTSYISYNPRQNIWNKIDRRRNVWYLFLLFLKLLLAKSKFFKGGQALGYVFTQI